MVLTFFQMKIKMGKWLNYSSNHFKNTRDRPFFQKKNHHLALCKKYQDNGWQVYGVCRTPTKELNDLEVKVVADQAPPDFVGAVPTLEDVYFASLQEAGVDIDVE